MILRQYDLVHDVNFHHCVHVYRIHSSRILFNFYLFHLRFASPPQQETWLESCSPCAPTVRRPTPDLPPVTPIPNVTLPVPPLPPTPHVPLTPTLPPTPPTSSTLPRTFQDHPKPPIHPTSHMVHLTLLIHLEVPLPKMPAVDHYITG